MYREQVTEVIHHTNNLFSFKTTRHIPWKTKFRAGEFTTIGLDCLPGIARPYSVASTPRHSNLEFLSIKTDGGLLTSKLQNIKSGDNINISNESAGKLILQNLLPGRILWLLATGTGIAPFLSLGRNPQTHNNFDRVIVTHTVQTNAELVYREELEKVGCEVFQTVVSEETDQHIGRICDYIYNGHLFDYFDLKDFNKNTDRIMLCGDYETDKEIQEILFMDNWLPGVNNRPGHFVREPAYITT
jgi:ferredoxin--NADP+ reductase